MRRIAATVRLCPKFLSDAIESCSILIFVWAGRGRGLFVCDIVVWLKVDKTLDHIGPVWRCRRVFLLS